ncbi:MAG: flavin reductase family protein [bacterium]
MVDFYQFYPCIVPLIGSRYKGETDLMPAAWQSGLSKDPMIYSVSISPKRYTHKLISSSGVFSANFIGFEHLNLLVRLGSISGRDIDKIKDTGVKLKPSVNLDVPIVEFAYAAYECAVQDIIKAGDHDLFIGRIVYVHETKDLKTESGTINYNAIKPILYLGKDTYVTINPSTVVTIKRDR